MASKFQKAVISTLTGLKMQKDEFSRLREMFVQLDRNKTGSLTVDELEYALKDVKCMELL